MPSSTQRVNKEISRDSRGLTDSDTRAYSKYINKQIKFLTLRPTQGIVALSDKKGTENLVVLLEIIKRLLATYFFH